MAYLTAIFPSLFSSLENATPQEVATSLSTVTHSLKALLMHTYYPLLQENSSYWHRRNNFIQASLHKYLQSRQPKHTIDGLFMSQLGLTAVQYLQRLDPHNFEAERFVLEGDLWRCALEVFVEPALDKFKEDSILAAEFYLAPNFERAEDYVVLRQRYHEQMKREKDLFHPEEMVGNTIRGFVDRRLEEMGKFYLREEEEEEQEEEEQEQDEDEGDSYPQDEMPISPTNDDDDNDNENDDEDDNYDDNNSLVQYSPDDTPAEFVSAGPAIPLHEFCEPSEAREGSCLICMEDLESGVVATCCQHLFHEGCLDGWVNGAAMDNSNTCPACRTVVCRKRERVHPQVIGWYEQDVDPSDEESGESNGDEMDVLDWDNDMVSVPWVGW